MHLTSMLTMNNYIQWVCFNVTCSEPRNCGIFPFSLSMMQNASLDVGLVQFLNLGRSYWVYERGNCNTLLHQNSNELADSQGLSIIIFRLERISDLFHELDQTLVTEHVTLDTSNLIFNNTLIHGIFIFAPLWFIILTQ